MSAQTSRLESRSAACLGTGLRTVVLLCLPAEKKTPEDSYSLSDLAAIPLWGSFWPGMLLLKPDVDGDMGKGLLANHLCTAGVSN